MVNLWYKRGFHPTIGGPPLVGIVVMLNGLLRSLNRPLQLFAGLFRPSAVAVLMCLAAGAVQAQAAPSPKINGSNGAGSNDIGGTPSAIANSCSLKGLVLNQEVRFGCGEVMSDSNRLGIYVHAND